MLATVLLATPTCDPQREACGDGPGVGLQIFVVLSILGIVVLGWILLRGYRDRDQ